MRFSEYEFSADDLQCDMQSLFKSLFLSSKLLPGCHINILAITMATFKCTLALFSAMTDYDHCQFSNYIQLENT